MKHVIASTAAGIAIAVAAGVGFADAATTPPGVQPANPHPRAVAATPLDTATESKYTPITPCRIADTRRGGGAIANDSTRMFQVSGSTGFTAQGGSGSGCGIPAAATSVSLSVTAVGQTNGGYVTVYPDGKPRPVANVLSFNSPVIITGNTDATLGSSGRIDAYVGGGGSTHLALDVDGYFITPMRAEVSSDGTVVDGSRVTSVTRLSTGSYEVVFDRDVSSCAYSATSSNFSTSMQVQPRISDADAVYVAAATHDGFAADTHFYLTVTC